MSNSEHFLLKCKVVSKQVSYVDHQSKTDIVMTEDFIYLIPQEGTQRDLFLDTWYPEVSTDVSEIGIRAGQPIYGTFRACLKRSNNIINEPHIFVMSRGAEEEFKKLIRAKKGFFNPTGKVYIEVEVLGEHEDELLDTMKDFHLSGKKDFSQIMSVK